MSPLPASGTRWPPPPHDVSLSQQAIWAAWMTGNPDTLSSLYGSNAAASSHEFFTTRQGPSITERQGGVIPTVARFFWGRTSTTGSKRWKLHVPLAADIATASADLLFSEPPQFTVDEESGGNEKAKVRVDEILNDPDFHARLLEAAEVAAGLGGAWIRLVWDLDVADYVMIDCVDADSGIGEWRWGRLNAVTFFTEYKEDESQDKVYRHLERYEPGVIYHGLYLGSRDDLGQLLSLGAHPSTAPYADLVNDDGAIALGSDKLGAAYVANMRPQRRWRKMDQLCELGRSDFDGVEPMMDSLDETYTSWMRDVRLSKSRIIVPEFMMAKLEKGYGLAWDDDKEVYSALNVPPSDSAAQPQITINQFRIRVEEHRSTALTLIEEILRTAGYAPSSFGFRDEGRAATTATEVTNRDKQSNRTRDKKTRYWGQTLESILAVWLEVDAAQFNTGAKGEISVEWADTTQPDPEALARTVETLKRAEAMSLLIRVKTLHPDWDEAEILEEVERIQEETSTSVPDLGPFTSDFGSEDEDEGSGPTGMPPTEGPEDEEDDEA